MDTATYIENERERHYRIAAVLNIIYASLGLFFGAIGALALFGLSAIPGLDECGDVGSVVLRILGYLVVVITVITTLPALIGGIGVLKKQPWARIVLLIVSVFNLFSFPIGTAIGIYTIWAMWERVGWVRTR